MADQKYTQGLLQRIVTAANKYREERPKEALPDRDAVTTTPFGYSQPEAYAEVLKRELDEIGNWNNAQAAEADIAGKAVTKSNTFNTYREVYNRHTFGSEKFGHDARTKMMRAIRDVASQYVFQKDMLTEAQLGEQRQRLMSPTGQCIEQDSIAKCIEHANRTRMLGIEIDRPTKQLVMSLRHENNIDLSAIIKGFELYSNVRRLVLNEDNTGISVTNAVQEMGTCLAFTQKLTSCTMTGVVRRCFRNKGDNLTYTFVHFNFISFATSLIYILRNYYEAKKVDVPDHVLSIMDIVNELEKIWRGEDANLELVKTYAEPLAACHGHDHCDDLRFGDLVPYGTLELPYVKPAEETFASAQTISAMNADGYLLPLFGSQEHNMAIDPSYHNFIMAFKTLPELFQPTFGTADRASDLGRNIKQQLKYNKDELDTLHMYAALYRDFVSKNDAPENQTNINAVMNTKDLFPEETLEKMFAKLSRDDGHINAFFQDSASRKWHPVDCANVLVEVAFSTTQYAANTGIRYIKHMNSVQGTELVVPVTTLLNDRTPGTNLHGFKPGTPIVEVMTKLSESLEQIKLNEKEKKKKAARSQSSRELKELVADCQAILLMSAVNIMYLYGQEEEGDNMRRRLVHFASSRNVGYILKCKKSNLSKYDIYAFNIHEKDTKAVAVRMLVTFRYVYDSTCSIDNIDDLYSHGKVTYDPESEEVVKMHVHRKKDDSLHRDNLTIAGDGKHSKYMPTCVWNLKNVNADKDESELTLVRDAITGYITENILRRKDVATSLYVNNVSADLYRYASDIKRAAAKLVVARDATVAVKVDEKEECRNYIRQFIKTAKGTVYGTVFEKDDTTMESELSYDMIYDKAAKFVYKHANVLSNLLFHISHTSKRKHDVPVDLEKRVKNKMTHYKVPLYKHVFSRSFDAANKYGVTKLKVFTPTAEALRQGEPVATEALQALFVLPNNDMSVPLFNVSMAGYEPIIIKRLTENCVPHLFSEPENKKKFAENYTLSLYIQIPKVEPSTPKTVVPWQVMKK